ncbi:Hpt domain-containing protein [Sphingomonas montanisoli]|uniref:Hpt domain-containing protein n=1 Tax=Sphingomonas montanisoli TaxID=2606412 RepID=A0A5D9BYF0_9SPHN|nr:Hpt domain-containing protein [Sphingomonas montanisoli]TZG24608.1 Hpt domain-containing protein [Sphingomonas montanisoli]
MMANNRAQPDSIVDWKRHDALHDLLEAEFPRLQALFKRDALMWIATIEQAVGASDAGELIRAAHTLQGDAFQFGALALGATAEAIERMARRGLDDRSPTTALRRATSKLRPLLANTVQQFEQASL